MIGLDRLQESAHPRLVAVTLVGIGVMVLAVVLALAGSVTGTGWAGHSLPLAIVGYLLFMFGGSGYVATRVFERRPDS